MKIILVPNVHHTHHHACVKDLQAIGFECVCPSNWTSQLGTTSETARNITEQEWIDICADGNNETYAWIFIAHHLNYIRHAYPNTKLIYCPCTKWENLLEVIGDAPMMSHEPMHFREYQGRKMWHFFRPEVILKPKNIMQSWRDKVLFNMINGYKDRNLGYEHFVKFKEMSGFKTLDYGQGAENGEINDINLKSKIMADSYFQLYLKNAGWCGTTVFESMQLGTPIASIRSCLYDADYLLNEQNSIITETLEELVERLNNITLDEYTTMSLTCIRGMERVLHDDYRQLQMKNLLHII